MSAANAIANKTVTAAEEGIERIERMKGRRSMKDIMIEGMKIAGSHNQQQGNCTELALPDVAILFSKVDGITDAAS